jgi:hypothetical protein
MLTIHRVMTGLNSAFKANSPKDAQTIALSSAILMIRSGFIFMEAET